ncbi:hypothetical protein JFK97_04995, partial [Chromobacterium phragmitis]|nr:hypothetical protein [Chromobacterium amazonense]
MHQRPVGAFSIPNSEFIGSSYRYGPDEFASHIYLRRSTYYFRQVVPGLGEINFSLRTGDKRTAKGLSRKISYRLLPKMTGVSVRMRMSDEQFSQLVFEAGEGRAQLELVDLKAVLDEIPSTPQEIIQWLRHEAKEVLREDLGLSSGDVSELIMLRKQDLKTLISEGSGTPVDFMKLEAGLELLDAAAAKIDKHDSKPLLRLSEGLSDIASLVPAEDASGPSKGLGGAVKGYVDAVAAGASWRSADGPTFAQLVEMYSKEQKLKGKWTDKTELENAAIYRTLTGLLPENVPASALTRQDFLKVAELLDTYPSNATKRYPGYTPLEMAAEGKKLDSKDVLSIRTRNKHTDRLSTVCKWAAQNGLILRNLAEGLGREEKGLASSARQPFTLEDVQRLFKAISDHKCVDPRKRDQMPKPFMYWMPVLAYYTGARVNGRCCTNPEQGEFPLSPNGFTPPAPCT